ncbi:MAG: DUF2520 domain-containing protein [Legionella sp.]|nr:DUF2520 domain-containing protein [Legionella sp.]
MTLRVNIIGAGHLGKTIGHLLVKNQLVRIGAICNRSEKSTLEAIKFIGQGEYCPRIAELPLADLTLITTPDDFITLACEELSQNQFIEKGTIIVHCSGSLTSDALISTKERGCSVASVHPMRSFARPELSIEHYSGTYCAIEGDRDALSTVTSLFNAIGSITYKIDKEKKSLYHAAGVFASNYVVTLAKQALACLKDAGVENEVAMHVITTIMRGTVANLERTLSPEQSLTGPIQRGDISTILKHIDSLTTPARKNLYSILGKATIHLTDHNGEEKNKIDEALNH